MKRREIASFIPYFPKFLLAFSIQVVIAAGICAQSSPSSGTPTPPVGSWAPAVTTTASAEADAVQRRMERARALTAAHQLPAAATELESIRASVKDDVMRNLSSLMLMGIYLEDGNYARAEAMLEETFRGRSAKSEGSVRTYFALAGQAVNGARLHVARYRTFGINVSSAGLPPEALSDLDRLRSLLERMSSQGKELIKENAKANDAFALLEEISGIRATLARDAEDRAKWQTEYSAARARLATLPTEIASMGGTLGMPAGGADLSTRSALPAVNDPNAAKQPVSTEGPAKPSENSGTPATIDATKSGTGTSVLELGSLSDRATSKVVPVYPQMAKSAGVSGLVRIKVIVDESGAVASIVWTEGPMLLRQAAQDALRQWKFQPVVVDGKPVRATGYVDFGFSR